MDEVSDQHSFETALKAMQASDWPVKATQTSFFIERNVAKFGVAGNLILK